jgi:ketosteroid isomerase-like protein
MAGLMERSDVQRWLDGYVAAWQSYDRDAIAALFAEGARYRYHPHDPWIEGRDAVVESWLGEGSHEGAPTRDEEGTYEAAYEPVAVEGDVAIATGTSTYLTEPGGRVEKVYDNCFVMRFDPDGRCREFTEWFVQRPDA